MPKFLATSQVSLALARGLQLTNGPQSIEYDAQTDTGFLWCDTPGCCDYDFDSLSEVLEYLEADDGDAWGVTQRFSIPTRI